MRSPTLRTVDEVLTDLKDLLGAGGSLRWPDAQLGRLLNRALGAWAGRVLVPHYLAFPVAFSTTGYALPPFIQAPVDLYVRVPADERAGQLTGETYRQIPGVRIEPTEGEGRQLRLLAPPGLGYGGGTAAFLVWYDAQGPVPPHSPKLLDDVRPTDVRIPVQLAEPFALAQSGYVRVDGEWMHYAGVTYAKPDRLEVWLENITRGFDGTATIFHDLGGEISQWAPAEWGIAADHPALFEQLIHQAASYAHGAKITDGSAEEVSQHERLMLDHRQIADSFWARYTPGREPRWQLE